MRLVCSLAMPGRARVSVLIADPDHVCATALRTALELDPRVDVVGVAPDGRVALDLAHDLDPDAVLAALGLPLVDPFELARRLRYDGCEASVVVVARNGERPIRTLGDAVGVSGFISRDAAPEDLRAVLFALASVADAPVSAG